MFDAFRKRPSQMHKRSQGSGRKLNSSRWRNMVVTLHNNKSLLGAVVVECEKHGCSLGMGAGLAL